MKYQAGDYEAGHPTPAWRERADFVFAARLETRDGRNEWEQLWGRKLAPRRFVLCCIPFFVSDLALGDEVETDADFVFQRVIKPGGQVAFRLWFGDQKASVRSGLVKEIETQAPVMEWSSENLLALSVAEAEAQQLADYLHAREQLGLLRYETGRR